MPKPDELPHFILISSPPRADSESLVKAWTHAISTLQSNLQTHFTVLEANPNEHHGWQGQGADGIKIQDALKPCATSSACSLARLPAPSCPLTSPPSACDAEDTGASAGDGNPFGASCIPVFPTMRYPVDVRWHQDLVYNAVWSLFVEVGRWNTEWGLGILRMTGPRPTLTKTTRRTIQRVLMPGLGTGYGQAAYMLDWGNVSSLIKEVNVTLEL